MKKAQAETQSQQKVFSQRIYQLAQESNEWLDYHLAKIASLDEEVQRPEVENQRLRKTYGDLKRSSGASQVMETLQNKAPPMRRDEEVI